MTQLSNIKSINSWNLTKSLLKVCIRLGNRNNFNRIIWSVRIVLAPKVAIMTCTKPFAVEMKRPHNLTYWICQVLADSVSISKRMRPRVTQVSYNNKGRWHKSFHKQSQRLKIIRDPHLQLGLDPMKWWRDRNLKNLFNRLIRIIQAHSTRF